MLSIHATSSRKRRAASEFAHAATPCLCALLTCVTVTTLYIKGWWDYWDFRDYQYNPMLLLSNYQIKPGIALGLNTQYWDY